MPKYEVEEHPDDSGSDDSARSLDSEFGVPIMRTPRVKKVLTSTNEKLCCSLRAKNSITLYAYNEYMTHHYAFTMKVVAEQKPESPSLRHRLEGEESNYRGKPEAHKAAQRPHRTKAEESRTTAQSLKKAESHGKAEESRTTAQRAKKTESRTDADEAKESQTGRWTPHT